ncbi:MAG TPA: YraN family protein [Methyloceanibacter sp.]|nr:YraN family protein [Methyloceanibacter sp.]
MRKRTERVRAYRRGRLAETLVAVLLRLKGHRIVARRYATPVGEIDLVALKGRRLAFVEVKRRKTVDDAAFSVTAKQRRRIVRAAQYWLASHPAFADHDIAFDVVLAAPWHFPRVIANAFPV